jgi:hypothetical protein
LPGSIVLHLQLIWDHYRSWVVKYRASSNAEIVLLWRIVSWEHIVVHLRSNWVHRELHSHVVHHRHIIHHWIHHRIHTHIVVVAIAHVHSTEVIVEVHVVVSHPIELISEHVWHAHVHLVVHAVFEGVEYLT